MKLDELFSEDEQAGFHGTVYENFASPEASPEPTYPLEKIFIGWSIGDSEMLREIMDKKMKQPELDANSARRQAFIEFSNKVGDKREPVFVDRGGVSNADIMFVPGKRGAGKSFLMRSMTNRSSKGGATNVLIDPKHEFYTNNQYNGIQEDLKNLREGEEKQNINTKVLMPYPVYKAREYDDLPENGYENMEVFKFSFDDLSPDDITFLIKNLGFSENDLDTLANEVQKELQDNPGSITSFEDVYDLAQEIEENDGFSWNQFLGRLDQALSPFQRWGLFGNEEKYQIDLQEIMNDYNNIVLSLDGGSQLPSNLPLMELYIAIMIRKNRAMAKRGDIEPPFNYAIDEAHKVVPSGVSTDDHTAKQQIRQTIKEDRSLGFRVSMVTQSIGDIDVENFVNQTDHFFLPHNLDPRSRRKMLEYAGVFSKNDDRREKWDYVVRNAPEYCWLYVDAKNQEWYLLEVASPLAYHD